MKSKLFGFLSVFVLAVSLCAVSAHAETLDNYPNVCAAPNTSNTSGVVNSATLAQMYGSLFGSGSGMMYFRDADGAGGSLMVPNYVVSIEKYSDTYGYGIYVRATSGEAGWLVTGSNSTGFYLIHCPVEQYDSTAVSWLQIISGRLENVGLQLDLVNITLNKINDNLVFFMNDRMHTLIDAVQQVSRAVLAVNGTGSGTGVDLVLDTTKLETAMSAMSESLGSKLVGLIETNNNNADRIVGAIRDSAPQFTRRDLGFSLRFDDVSLTMRDITWSQYGFCSWSIPVPHPAANSSVYSHPAGAVVGDGFANTDTLTVKNVSGGSIGGLYGIPVSSGGNVTIDGQRYVCDTVDSNGMVFTHIWALNVPFAPYGIPPKLHKTTQTVKLPQKA